MERISKTKAVQMVKSSRGRFFTVVFNTENDGERCYNCRYVGQTDLGLINIKTKDGNKSFYPKNLKKLKINKNEYAIRK